jgi:mannose-1-phosphate guanylyltransferase/mannose-6-phosphate isomerase
MMGIVPVVLCGGAGTRLWPLSRQDYAKQHVPILGGGSPFQRTLQRLAAVSLLGRPLVVGGISGRFMAADQAAATGVEIDLLLEPAGRDTLAAIAAATLVIARRDPDALILILPSDHLVADVEHFAETIERAAQVASDGALVTFGLQPTAPATAYGYIRPAHSIDQTGYAPIAAFEEKPDQDRAALLIEQGCLWNAGMFLFSAKSGLEEMRRLAPETMSTAELAVTGGSTDLDAYVLGSTFATIEKVSFDYAIMEKTQRGIVVRSDFSWSDIGDWKEIYAQSSKDEAGLALEGDVIALDSRNSYLRSDGRLVCAIGVENLVLVDTPDAVLVAPLDRTQDVKKLVMQLQAAGRSEVTTPARVYRPWGWYQTVDLGDRFRVKRILVWPGKKLSLQKHYHRAEHWVVVRGTAEVTRDKTVDIVRENESIYLTLGCVHRLGNPGKIPVEIIEVQTGPYLEEDDIVRFEDDFGRK